MPEDIKAYFSIFDYVKIGYSYKVKMSPFPKRVHIRAIVDDSHIVYTWYGKRKQWWHYGVESISYFQLLYDGKQITDKKKSPSKHF